MSDIAVQAGVTKATVSLALKGDKQISGETRRRIAKLARAMGYRRNPTVDHLMAELRKMRSPAHQASLALLNANQDRAAFTRHPTIPMYVKGCRRRAEELGYSFDEFWLHEPELYGERLNKILHARGIKGVVVVGLMKDNRLPEKFSATWEAFPTVVTGVRTRDPALSFTCTDHHMLGLKAFQRAVELGYRRPALVLDHVIDGLTDGRFSAGVRVAQAALPLSRRTKPFYLVKEARGKPLLFQRWFNKEKPDAILTLYNVVRTWLKNRTDVGLIQLEWRKSSPEWAGMDQHNDVVGETAVEMVVGMIHHGVRGIPDFPRGTLIGSTWVEGSTVSRYYSSEGSMPMRADTADIRWPAGTGSKAGQGDGLSAGPYSFLAGGLSPKQASDVDPQRHRLDQSLGASGSLAQSPGI
jgi:LacI family transcriptional regulator